MDLKAGYKQTEVGVIPVEWDSCVLANVVTKVGSGITPTGGELVYKQEGRPFLRSQNIGWGHLIIDDIAYIDEATHQSFPASEIQLNDVLLNITGASIGRSAIADERVVRGNVNQHVCIIRTEVNRLHPYYLNLFLLSKNGQGQIDSFQAGGNRQGLNFGQIKSFKFPLPPLPEQRAIAAVLGDVDALITELDALIAKQRAIKQATMHELLTGKTRLPGFSGAWARKTLGEITEINMGQSPDSRYYNQKGHGTPLIQGNADIENRATIKRVWTTQAPKICNQGDLILTVRAPVGTIAIASEDACLGRGVCSLKPIHDDVKFLFHVLVFAENKWKVLEQGSTFTSANSKQIREFPLLVSTSHQEQRAIAAVLSDMDSTIAVLEQRRAKTIAVKEGMMQELLTGKTRLIDN